jgi:translation initiation factor IF-2
MEKEIGKVTHFWGHISVAGIDLTKGELKVGDMIHVKGSTTDFTQRVESIHIGDNAIEKAKIGDSIGVKVEDRVRENDVVYLITEE